MPEFVNFFFVYLIDFRQVCGSTCNLATGRLDEVIDLRLGVTAESSPVLIRCPHLAWSRLIKLWRSETGQAGNRAKGSCVGR